MTDGMERSAVRGPVVVTALLLVAASVLLVALRAWLDAPSTPDDFGPAALIVDPSGQFAPVYEAETEVEQTVEATSADTPAEDLPTSNLSIESLKVVLLPGDARDPDRAAALLADSIRQVTLRTLRGMANVEVVDVAPGELAAVVPASAAPESSRVLVLGEASRVYGSDIAAEIEVRATNNGLCLAVGLRVVRPGGPTYRGTRIRRTGDPGPGNDPETIGIRYAEVIAFDTRAQAAASAVRSDARDVLIDAMRPDEERIRALTTLKDEQLDSESAAAAAELAARSASPETRAKIWTVLAGRDDAALAQPMSIALQSDPDAAVRREAALGLKQFLDNAGVRPALAQAAVGDASADVRVAARMAMMDVGEQHDFIVATLLDRSLAPAERLAPMVINPFAILFLSIEDFGGDLSEAMLAYAEIISGTDDPELKLSALSALQRTTLSPGLISGQRLESDATLVNVLVETATAADERLQRAALLATRPFAGHPEIRAMLESVLADNPNLARELHIAESLALPLPQAPMPVAPPPPC